MDARKVKTWKPKTKVMCLIDDCFYVTLKNQISRHISRKHADYSYDDYLYKPSENVEYKVLVERK